jgi:hypothetical protein
MDVHHGLTAPGIASDPDRLVQRNLRLEIGRATTD